MRYVLIENEFELNGRRFGLFTFGRLVWFSVLLASIVPDAMGCMLCGCFICCCFFSLVCLLLFYCVGHQVTLYIFFFHWSHACSDCFGYLPEIMSLCRWISAKNKTNKQKKKKQHHKTTTILIELYKIERYSVRERFNDWPINGQLIQHRVWFSFPLSEKHTATATTSASSRLLFFI